MMRRILLGALVGAAAFGAYRYFTLQGYPQGVPIMTAWAPSPELAAAAGFGALAFWAVH